MAPSGSLKKFSRRLRAISQVNSYDGTRVRSASSAKRRVEHDVIEGIDIYSFNDELELEYFSNIEEPFPRKIKRFRGFHETDASLDLIKKCFGKFVKSFISAGNIDGTTTDRPLAGPLQPRKDSLERIGESDVRADKKASMVLVSDDDNSLNATYNVPNVITGPIDDRSVRIKDKLEEVITINDSDSDDEDVVLISDPKAPLPQPVRDCVCPNCGKVKRAEPRQKGRIMSESNGGTGRDDVSIVTDEVLIITDEDMPVQPEEAPVPPKEVTVQLEAGSTQPEEAAVQLEDVDKSINQSREDVVMITDDDVPVEREEALVPPKDVSVQHEQPIRLSVHPEELPAPQIRKPVATSSGDESLLKAHGECSLTDHSPHNVPLKMPHVISIAPEDQKPASHLIKKQPSVPETVKLILPETGKTVILKLDGAKSKMLPPSTKNPLVRTFRFVVPRNELKHRVSVPGFPDQNTAIEAQQANTTIRRVEVRNSHIAKPTIVAAAGSRLHRGLARSSQSQVKQQAVETVHSPDEISLAKNLKESHVVSDPDKVRLGVSNEVNCSMVKTQTYDVASILGVNPTTTETTTSKPLVVEYATRSVVQDLVDFVCRKQQFPTSYPYDQKRTETPCLSVPCRELRCRLGCICISLAKKTVRRVRCKNASCIFGCNCMSHGVAHPSNRHAKTSRIEKKIMSISRQKQVLTVLPCSDPERFEMSSDAGSGAQTALKSFLPVQKVVGASGSQQSHSDSNSGIRHGTSSQPATKALLQRLAPGPSQPTPKVLGTQKSSGYADRQSSCPNFVNGLSIPVTQPRRYFGREKIPIPERALMCLTPGLGYVPLVEITPRVTLLDPFKSGSTKSFLHIREATEWLNSNLLAIFITASDLRWVVADRSTIEKKQMHRLSVDALKSPNCTISRSGPVFTS